MSMFIRFWRELTILGLLGVLFIGYKTWPSPVAPAPDVKENVQVNQVVKVKTTRPDGTIEEKVTILKKDTKVTTSNADKKSNYSIGAYINAMDRSDYRVDVAARIGKLPAFGVVGYEFKDKTVFVGVRVEF